MKAFKPFLFILLIHVIHHTTALAQPDTLLTTPPPYQMYSEQFMMVLFNLNEADVSKLLPEGIQAKVNEEGKVLAALEMYETQQTYGIPSYKAAFIVVDVLGYDSGNGTSGHFAIWGNVDTEKAQRHFKHAYGLPFEVPQDMQFTKDGTTASGNITLADGTELKLTLSPIAEQPFNQTGIVNMVGEKAGNFQWAEVPWITNGHAGKLEHFSIGNTNDPILKLCKDVQPIWCLLSPKQIFSYSKPQRKESPKN